ncbi:MAG: undecaprenyl/decaprenyl-phosphate alpha-N-acetylglucosaminyl 1-phosphate transferase [bacterium]|nr:undecaprenyl/decaprenyl-phosphate alpha-N-acetylglucosaminyl 1-phosphate transferase [bacterium]
MFLVLLPFGPGTPSYLSWKLNIRWIYIILFAFSITTLIVPLFIKLSFKLNILDYPDERKIHNKPIPRIGGLAILTGFIITFLRHSEPFTSPTSYLPLLLGFMFFILNLIDDVGVKLSSSVRFILQIVFSTLVALMGLRITLIPNMPFEYLIEVIVTIIWIVGITNAFNFLDGVDGLASSLASVITFSMLFLAWTGEQVDLSVILATTCGAALGFLVFNWSPAMVFMGDSGSTFLGAVISSAAVLQSWAKESEPLRAAILPLTVISIPIFDMVFTTIFRITKANVRSIKEWLAFTGKDHIHHRIMNLGFSSRGTVVILAGVQIVLCINAIILKMSNDVFIAILLFMQSIMIYIIGASVLWKR